MANLRWRILPLCDEQLLADAKDDMQRAGWFATKRDSAVAGLDLFEDFAHSGCAAWGSGNLVTPVEEEACLSVVGLEARVAHMQVVA